MNKRAYLTGREMLTLIKSQGYKCALCPTELMTGTIGSDGRIHPDPIEYDHSTPVALGNDKKPDQALCISCHKRKTKRDVKAIAKAKRLHRTFVLGITKQKRPIPSRGFEKRWKRRINKPTVLREAA